MRCRRCMVAAFVVILLSFVGVAGEDESAAQQQTVNDIRVIGTCIEAYAVDHAAYPVAATMQELADRVTPAYARELPSVDGWGNRFEVRSSESTYELRSLAADGLRDSGEPVGATTDANLDIVFSEGRFVQWPAEQGS